MTTLTVRLPRPHDAQRRVLAEARRFNVLSMGRRWGKSTLGVDRLTGPALEGYPVAWFSPTYRMLAEVWRDTRRILRPVTARPDVQQRRLELVTGGVVEFWSLDSPDVARGRKYRRVIVDEAAMIGALEDAWQAVIRPTLTDYRGDGWFLSTPKGRNFFWSLWQRGQDPQQTDWASWQMPTTTNPFIDPAEVEDARRELPERTFAQEYLAQFLEDQGAVFRGVEACATLPGLTEPNPARQTVMGVDWGKSYDFTVLVVLDARTREVLDFDRFNQIDWHVQRQRLKTMQERWRCTSILAEANSIGDPNIEALRRERPPLPVQGFQTTNATKAQIVEELVLAIETKRISYPRLPVLIGELQAYELNRLPSGIVRYGAPEGQHDDCVIALALANHAAETGRPFTPSAGGSRPAVVMR